MSERLATAVRGRAARIEFSAPRWAFPAFAAAAAFLPFLSALRFGFVNMDDGDILPRLTDLSWASLKRIFTTFEHGGAYHPVEFMTDALDHMLWGGRPEGYHLTSLLLHAAVSVALYFLARRLLALAHRGEALGGDRPLDWRREAACAAAAAVFAASPLRVEPVVWISARAYVLVGLFVLLSVHAYLSAQASRRTARVEGGEPAATAYFAWMALSVAAYASAAFTYAVFATLPALLLILDAYPLGRFRDEAGRSGTLLSAIAEKTPYVLVALLGASIVLQGREEAGRVLGAAQVGWLVRLAHALFGAVFYLEHTVLPVRLSPIYTVPPDQLFDLRSHPFDMVHAPRTLAFAAITATCLWAGRRRPA
ncbi:MAG: hypothetical protein HY553_04015, partial [Elusimicrobia bacterium]|nr:hypothetical protein [Elusimicrobiota bacterium]